MTQLLVHVPEQGVSPSGDTKFGGQPSAPFGTLSWPVCRSCNGNMQFLGQLRSSESEELLLLFMCQNTPGMCEEWDPDAGGNSVIAIPAMNLKLVEAPPSGEVVRPIRHGAMVVVQEGDDYETARTTWSSTNAVSPREVLGQLGGTPTWIQEEEIPSCDGCEQPMTFVAQLEQGPDWKSEMNFGGGGCAYVFRCNCARGGAKMLWQC